MCDFTDGGNTYTEDIVLHKIKSDNGTILSAWRTAYNAISIINDVLYRLEIHLSLLRLMSF